MKICKVMLLAGMVSGKALAAEYPIEQDFFQELPIVLSASRLSQPISETPNAMTVIDHDMIVASGARNIAEVFKLVPGMYVGYVNGHSPIVSYRGNTDMYSRRMQVLVDGRSIYLPIFGQVDWEELPIDITDIARIEVVRGPAAASHGSNSVQGVINIITHEANAINGSSVSVRKGDAGISDIYAHLGSIGENLDYRVTVASLASNGFDTLDDTSSKKLANARISYRMNNTDSFDLHLGYSDTSRQMGDRVPASGTTATSKAITTPLREQKTLSDFQQITWLHTAQQGSDVQLKYYRIARDARDAFWSVPCPIACGVKAPSSYWIDDSTAIIRHDLEMQHTLQTASSNRLVWGMGARQDSVDSPASFLANPKWREYRVFAHDEWRMTPMSILNIGAMAEKNAQGQVRLSPRASYNHHLSNKHTLRASASMAYRNPEMVEVIGNHKFSLAKVGATQYIWRDILASGNLQPERIVSREIGYIGQLDEAGSTLDVRAFHDHISDIIWVDIVADPLGAENLLLSPRSFMSDFHATHTGIESTLNYNIGSRSRLTVNYAHQVVGGRQSRVSPIASINRALINYAYAYQRTVPLNSGSLLFSHDFHDGMQIGAGYYHTDPLKILEGGTAAQTLERTLDLRIAQRFGSRLKKKGSAGGEIALIIQNALNDHHLTYSKNIIGKRRAYLAGTFDF